MYRSWYILLMVVAVCFAADANAQDGVVMHGDPRLGLLMKKEKTIARANIERERAVAKAPAADKNAAAGKPGTSSTLVGPPPAPGTAGSTTSATPEKPVAPPKPVYTKLISPPDGRVIYSGKGFRVQIYNGPDRNKAIDIKMEFMRQHPAMRTYLTYVAPCFRVKVGNYRNRSDAEGMLREAKSVYNPSMIVPDIITINTY